MREGWKCPVCGKGVSPDKDICDHAGQLAQPWPVHPVYPVYPVYPNPYIPYVPYWNGAGCAACSVSGICNCVRYDRMITISSTSAIN